MTAWPRKPATPIEPTSSRLLSLNPGGSTTTCVVACLTGASPATCAVALSTTAAALCIVCSVPPESARSRPSAVEKACAASGSCSTIAWACPRNE